MFARFTYRLLGTTLGEVPSPGITLGGAVLLSITLGGAVLLGGCGGGDEGPQPGAEAVVASVGEADIGAREFVLDYEFGFSLHKRGPNPRRAYLDRMIDERLLALEGYRQRLDTLAEVRALVDDLREALLVEELFRREVNAHVEVTDAEVQEAARKEAVRFRLRYFPVPSLEAAHRLRREIASAGFEAVVRRRLSADGVPLSPADFTSPYIGPQDVDPRLLDAVTDLPVGVASAPVAYRGSYLILEVADVQRQPVAPVLDRDAYARFEQALFQREAKARARAYIGEMMKPLDVRLKAGAYRAFRDALRAWLSSDAPPSGNLLAALAARGDDPALRPLRALLPEVLFTTRDGAWTVEDFLAAYPAGRYPLRARDEQTFADDLYDGVGLTLRDRAFVAKARREGLEAAPEVQEELKRWTDKWVYRAQRRRVADTLSTPGALDAYLQTLRQRYPVRIYESVLDTIAVTTPAAGRPVDVLLMKGHTMQPAYPVVDPNW